MFQSISLDASIISGAHTATMRAPTRAPTRAQIAPRVADACVACFEDGGNGVPRTYCSCCGTPMCDVCKAAYFAQLASGAGCPNCRSTGGAVFVTVHVRMDGPVVYVPARSRVTLRMDGAKTHLVVSERAARIMLRKNVDVVRTTREPRLNPRLDPGVVPLRVYRDSLRAHTVSLRKMVENVCDAILGNLESDATVDPQFRQGVRDGRVRCTFKMVSNVAV